MKRILLVDDHPDIRRLVRLTLGKLYDITEADNAPAALELLRQSPPDLLVADVMMPGEIDGLGLLDAVRADPALSALPVIMVTSEAARYNVVEAIKAGVSDYVVKPVTARAVLEKVDKYLKGAGA